MTNDEQITVLRAVKERLFTKGWVQGDLGPPDGPNCIIGALRYSVNNGQIWQVNLAIEEVVDKCFKDRLSPVASFNDNEGTTFDDVLDVIDLTIKSLESE